MNTKVIPRAAWGVNTSPGAYVGVGGGGLVVTVRSARRACSVFLGATSVGRLCGIGGTRRRAMRDYFRGEIAGQILGLSANATEFFGKGVQAFDSSIVVLRKRSALGQRDGGAFRQLTALS